MSDVLPCLCGCVVVGYWCLMGCVIRHLDPPCKVMDAPPVRSYKGLLADVTRDKTKFRAT